MIYGLSNVLGRLLNFVLVTPFLTEVMASEEFGVVGEMFFYTALLIALLVFRMDTVVFRFASRAENDPRAVFQKAQSFVVVAVVLVIGMLLFWSDQIAAAIEYPDRAIYVKLVLLTVAFDALSAVPLARLRLENRPWFFVFVNLGNVLLNLLLIFLLLWVLPSRQTFLGLTYDEGYLVGYYLATITVASAFRYILLLFDGLLKYGKRKALPKTLDAVTLEEKRTNIRLGEMLRYSMPLTLVAVAVIINALFGPALIKWYYGENVTGNLFWSGQFNAALKLAVFLNLFITAYNYAAEPYFFRQAGNDPEKADKQIYADATRTYAIVGMVASTAILLFLPWLKNFLDEGEQQGLYVLPYLLGANFLFGLYYNFAIAYKLTDRTYLGGIISVAGSLVAVLGSIWLIDEYEIRAVAWSMLACYGLMCTLAYFVSRKYFPVQYPLLRIALYLLLAVGATMLAARLEGAENWTLAGTSAGSAGAADAGAKWYIRGAVFALLLAAFGALEHKWVRRTFL